MKTTSNQLFGGRQIGLTMMALACLVEGFGEVWHVCVCIDFDADEPVFRSLLDLSIVDADLKFVEKESTLVPGTWTWKE